MSLSIDDDWLKPTEPQTEDQRDAGHSSSVTGGNKNFRQCQKHWSLQHTL